MHDEQAAQRVTEFIERYCCQKNGQPIKLLPWQLDIIDNLYGTKNEDGTRQYRQAFVFVPRRSGKSTFFACLLIFHLVCDEPASEIYVVSNTLTQSADAVFDACLAIVESSAALAGPMRKGKRKGGLLKVLKTINRIINTKNRSRLAVLSSTHQGLLGKDASVICNDEIGFFRDRRLYTNLKGSQLNRKQPLNLSITTASDNLEGIGKELYDYAVKVRDGVVEDPTFLPVIYEARPDQDWREPETWRTANPSMGTLFKEDDLAKLAKEAEHEPRKQSEFKQFHLNLWQHSAVCWLTREAWDACRADFSEDDFTGQICVCGADLAKRHDMAALAYLFKKGEDYYVVPRFFLPKANIIAKENSDHAPYTTWAEQGYLTLTDGDVIDYAVIRDTIKKDADKFKVDELAYDPWSGELLFNQQLRQEDGFNAVEVRQRIDIIGPTCGQFERLIKEKRIKHNNNPILNWHAASVSVRTDENGNITTSKKNSKSRYDGIAAMLNALSRCLADDMGPSIIIFD